ncbi:MAG: 1-acyl-sn-glycerol-3-phosphate acyltransferase [Chthoniobacterales bacterium]|nr:1-acyl-sn-glycerol-3-phosphate acyltransferase [Chthoniobacterales bacterium]
MCYTCCSLVARGIFRLFCRVHVVILEAPPKKGSFIMASNHISHFDPPLLSAFFPRALDWLGMNELFKHPWSARFFSWLRVIPIDRFGKKAASNRHALKKMRLSLASGRALGIFPEGGIRSGAASILEQAPMKPGLASFSFLNQAPVIPCVVLGTDRLYVKHTWFRRTPLWIIVGKAIIPPTLDATNREEVLHCFQKKLADIFPALQQELRERFQLSHDDLPKTAKERSREK